MNKTLICSDLDGTLLNKNHKYSIFTKHIINKIMCQNNILFVINTGRVTKSAILQAQKLNCHKYNSYVIANNGSQIWSFKDEKMIYDKYLEYNEIKIIDNILSKNADYVSVHYYAYDSIFVYKKDPESEFWSKVMKSKYSIFDFSKYSKDTSKPISRALLISNISSQNKIIDIMINKLLNSLPNLSIVKQSKNVYEISRKNINKGEALKFLSRKLKISIRDTLAFGNSYNDIPLIKKSGVGLVVNNAEPELKKIADQVISSNRKNGPAMFLWKNYLNK